MYLLHGANVLPLLSCHRKKKPLELKCALLHLRLGNLVL